MEAEIIDSFGMVYEAARQRQRALGYYQETLTLARQIGYTEIETLEIKNIARQQRYLARQRPSPTSAHVE